MAAVKVWPGAGAANNPGPLQTTMNKKQEALVYLHTMHAMATNPHCHYGIGPRYKDDILTVIEHVMYGHYDHALEDLMVKQDARTQSH